MPLRYNGKPSLVNNVVVGPVPVCLCKEIGQGHQFDRTKCDLHRDLQFSCDFCGRRSYSPYSWSRLGGG